MGEYSKRIGDVGESIVWSFLETIGWSNVQRNFDIPSTNPDKHKKKSHGVDGFFSYRSPMISNTVENVLISSKFSSNPYPNSPIQKFKDYYSDLGMAVESFKNSTMRQEVNNKYSGFETGFDRGIIFWLTNIEDDLADLSKSLVNIVMAEKYAHNGIFLVDNRRVAFIYDTMNFAELYFDNSLIEFLYFQSGLNNDDTSKRNGEILPIQYFTSSILPLRIQNRQTDETTILLSSIDNFEEGELLKLMGLAKSLGNNAQVKTVICFPDYNTVLHEQSVNNTKQTMDDPSFTRGLTISNFNYSLRG